MEITVETEMIVKMTMTGKQLRALVLWLLAAAEQSQKHSEAFHDEITELSRCAQLPDPSNETLHKHAYLVRETGQAFTEKIAALVTY